MVKFYTIVFRAICSPPPKADSTRVCLDLLAVGYRRPSIEFNIIYLGGAVCGGGSTETVIRSRIQAGANARWKVEGMMGHIYRK